jgi:hypothetical protein
MIRPRRALGTMALVLCLSTGASRTGLGPAHADAEPAKAGPGSPHEIRLLEETLRLPAGVPAETSLMLAEQARAARARGLDRIHVLVQLHSIPSSETRAGLATAGLELQHYVPGFAWIAAIPVDRVAAVAGSSQLHSMVPWTAERKQHPRLKRGDWASWVRHPAQPMLMLLVQLHAEVPLSRGAALAEAHAGVPMPPIAGLHGLTVWLPEDNIAALATEEEILWIEEGPPPLSETNDGVLDSLQVNDVNAAPYDLDGTGVRLFVFDGGSVRATHQNFDATPGRVTVIDAAVTSSHATHVAGTAAGDGGTGSGARARGVAPAASILSAGYSQAGGTMLFWDNAGDIEADYSTARNTHNADLGTNSIGSNTASNGYDCAREGDYGVSSELLDGIVRGDNPTVASPVIMTWANGNERSGFTTNLSGQRNSPVGRCGASYHTTAPPSCAKNPIHVGATNSDFDSMTRFSSWGPCDDGRLKPLVSAPGCQLGRSPGGLGGSPPLQETGIFSSTSTSNTSYGGSCGTSMATPAVAGIVALMLQQWRALGHGGANARPLPALVKALLMHTARDLGQDGPDYIYGYGEVDAKAAVDALRGGTALGGAGPIAWGNGSISDGAVQTFTLSVPAGMASLKASLAWDDHAATAFSAGALVNDLDLEDADDHPHGYLHRD